MPTPYRLPHPLPSRRLLAPLMGLLFILLASHALAAPTTAPNTKSAFQAGTHYKNVKNPYPMFALDDPSPLRPDYAYKITVVEFFSYGCHWCHRLEPVVRNWEKNSKPDYIALKKIPVTFRRGWDVLGKLHFVAENLQKHHRFDLALPIFTAIHDNNKNLSHVDTAAAFLAQQVYDNVLKKTPAHQNDDVLKADAAKRQYTQQYKRALLTNPAVDVKLTHANEMITRFGIHAIPSFVVAGLYETNIQMADGDPQRLMAIIDFLAEQSKAIIEDEIKQRKQTTLGRP